MVQCLKSKAMRFNFKKKHTVLHVCPLLWICDNLLRPESHRLDLIKIVVFFSIKIYYIYNFTYSHF